MRIPFDSFTLAAVVRDLQDFIGAKVQKISQPSDRTVVLEIYGGAGQAYLLLSSDPQFARVHFTTKKPNNPDRPPQFCTALRSRLSVSRIVGARQIGFDRILQIDFETPEGEHYLVAELMGKHSNLILLDGARKIVGASRWVGKHLSARPIQAGAKYVPPPFEPKPSLLTAIEGQALRGWEGASPFLLRLIEGLGPGGLAKIQDAVRTGRYHPILATGHGAYPVSVACLGLEEQAKPSIGIALEQHYDRAIPAAEADALKTSLRGQLQRVILAREAALSDLDQAISAGEGAGKWQIQGELVLAYGPGSAEGSHSLDAWDYAGNPVVIKLDPDLSYKENANRFFDKARRAKARLSTVKDQRERLGQDLLDLLAFVTDLENRERLGEVRAMVEEARARRWLHKRPAASTKKEDRPFEGHRIRELLGPGGVTVLYGENAESNDYLTLRVAKPNDIWLHVRGSISAHVVIQTGNQPDKVQKESLLFAAKIAVQNSPSKHSGYVPVDYTLKKYVRKPKGAPKGTALYTHEKTLNVDLDRQS